MRTGQGERGSVLIIAVIAMLIMGVLSVSFALLADIESRIGVNYKLQGQAETIAEAALERARDAVRGAVVSGNFTSFIATGNFGFNGAGLGGGTYNARIDNDCPPLVPNIATIVDPNCAVAGSEAIDNNETAVITAWAAAGVGKARVRAIVGIDNVWKHVCSTTTADTYCNDDSNTNGNPTITPGDPNDPNGPSLFDDLPRPVLGCSRVDPTIHLGVGGALRTPANQLAACGIAADLTTVTDASKRAMFSYPPSGYPPHAAATEPRFVVMGAESGPFCNGGGQTYFGYFDCALTTPCPAAICGALRPACVRQVPVADTRIDGVNYIGASAAGACQAAGATGMVFIGNVSNFPSYGSLTDRLTVYIHDGTFHMQSDVFHGTVVVEGNSNTPSGTTSPSCTGANKDAEMKSGAQIWTGPTSGVGPGSGVQPYGYPMALLVYDPDLPAPTPTSWQNTCGDMGSAADTQIHGIIYTGGRMEFNPFQIDGTIVGFDIYAQGSSSTYLYNYKYGNDSPPPGFDSGAGGMVVLYRKSFIGCASYSDESGGATACQ